MQLQAQTQLNHWHIRVRPAHERLDGHARGVLADIRRAGLSHVEGVHSSRIYLLEGCIQEGEVRRIAEYLLTDAVAESFEFGRGFSHRRDSHPAIEVHVQPGVMNPTANSSLAAMKRLLQGDGGAGEVLSEVQVVRRYEIVGARSAAELEQIATRVLANACIENWYIQGFGRSDPIPDRFAVPPERPFVLRRVSLRDLDEDALCKLSRQGHLFLSLEEMKAIRGHFNELGRDPTDLEIETFAQTWSEHCVHKTLKSAVIYRGEPFGQTQDPSSLRATEGKVDRLRRPGPEPSSPGQAQEVEVRFENLLRDTIVAATRRLDRDWCLSVFVDNAGVIAFDDDYGIAFKVETHNHPSAIEPYGGASTGVGGCIRDIMGCGLGAKPVASTDVFCLAPPDFNAERLPKDVLHPRRVLKGVVSGVRDYGNRMGIPTVNGAILFEERYLANPLVFCGCVGLIPRNRIEKQVHVGDRIVVAGGRTGRDGIHGATFSSAELTDTHADEFAHAVQIGNAIEEKKLLDALLIARDHSDGCLFSAVTDCGAGGLSSAVGEMAAKLGAVLDLEKVPLKYAGLRYDEIWISEAQERMVFSVPPQCLESFLQVFADEEVEATVIGTFTGDRVLRVRYRGETVGELDVHFLHEGLPRNVREARWSSTPSTSRTTKSGRRPAERQVDPREFQKAPPRHDSTGSRPDPQGFRLRFSSHDSETLPNDGPPTSCNARLLALLGNLNVASKEWVIRQYDHEVQGRSVIKPIVGPGFGPSDAAVIRPRLQSYKGIALACGLCPQLTDVDPYWMAIAAVDEALRNVICVGADPTHTAILDNFCWPKVDSPESLGSLVRACRGAADAALAYGLPFISGKDSLNNEFSMSKDEAQRTNLPPRLAIPGTLLISALGMVNDVRRCVSMDLKDSGNCLVLASAPVDRVGMQEAQRMHQVVAGWISNGIVRSAHDISDGGLATTIAEMCIASRLGAVVELAGDADDGFLFEGAATTYVLEMAEKDADSTGLPILGRVQSTPNLVMTRGGSAIITLSVDDLAKAWSSALEFSVGSGV